MSPLEAAVRQAPWRKFKLPTHNLNKSSLKRSNSVIIAVHDSKNLKLHYRVLCDRLLLPLQSEIARTLQSFFCNFYVNGMANANYIVQLHIYVKQMPLFFLQLALVDKRCGKTCQLCTLT